MAGSDASPGIWTGANPNAGGAFHIGADRWLNDVEVQHVAARVLRKRIQAKIVGIGIGGGE